jgi:uncharacterized FAD-dependent dehydrogenase
LDVIISNLRIPIEEDGITAYLNAASKILNTNPINLIFKKIVSKSLNTSNANQFYYEVSIVVSTDDRFDNKDNFPIYREAIKTPRKSITRKERPIIIGFGPAGMFAALELLESGLQPLIFERGKKIEERTIDVLRFIRERVLDLESNIQFGEGGAGSYSDGKLFSRMKNSEYVGKVLDTFIKFGAPEEIGYVSKPHIGTDVLCRIVKNIRNYILERGGEIHYNSKMTDVLIDDGKAFGVVINGEKEYRSSMIFLAVGHSARDTFEMIHNKGIALEQKPISVGLRIEHPAETINLLRYGKKYKNFPGLGAATYSLNYTDRKIKRGVYTFCMCPGGEVVNASSEQGMMVLNGMSYSRRSSAFSNSALVVTCQTNDYPSASPLAGMEFQREIERKVFHASGGRWEVPAQNLPDFLNKTTSKNLNENSYAMGAVAVSLDKLLPLFVSDMLAAAFHSWKEEYPLFVSEEAILFGAETRTSSPVKMKRSENYQSVSVKNLYPIGEGSGYTGGITSSAADAIKAVERVLATY